MEQATTIRTFLKISFKIASKNPSRYLGMHLIKVVKDLYTENDKFPNVVPKFLRKISKVLIGSIYYAHSLEDNIFTKAK